MELTRGELGDEFGVGGFLGLVERADAAEDGHFLGLAAGKGAILRVLRIEPLEVRQPGGGCGGAGRGLDAPGMKQR